MGAVLRAVKTYVAWVLALVVGVVGGVVFLAPVSAADAPGSGTGSISGTITWPQGEAPEPSVRLHRWAERDGAFRWTTFQEQTVLSADGTYTIEGVPAGRYLVEAEDLHNDLAPAFHGGLLMSSATKIQVAENGAVTGIGIALVPGGSVEGNLTVPKDAGVVSLNVKIFLRDNDGAGTVWRQVGMTPAETEGRYQARSLRPGTYKFEFVDYAGVVQSEFYDDAATIGQGVDVVVGREAAVANIDADLEYGGTIAGRISAPVKDEALGKLHVTVYQFGRDGSGQWEPVNTALTDLEGRYRVTGLSAGTYRVGFEDVENGLLLPEFHPDVTAVERAKDVVLSHREVVTVDAVMGVGAALKGVVSSPEGLPVHDVEVSAHRREGSGVTASWHQVGEPVLTAVGGAYRFLQLPPGTYRVQFEDPNEVFVPEFWDDATTLAAARDINVTSGGTTSGIDSELSSRASLSGTVTAGALTVIGVRVKAYARVGGAWQEIDSTDVRTNGRWELAGLAAGTYRLEFTDPTGRLRSEFHDDAATLAAAKDLVLIARGRITGIATELVSATTPTPTPKPKTIKRAKAPKISGTAKVGKTLKVSKGVWKPSSVKVKFQWFTKKGKKLVKVKGGKNAKLKLKKSMPGKRYLVRVTVYKKGYRTVTYMTKWSKKVKK